MRVAFCALLSCAAACGSSSSSSSSPDAGSASTGSALVTLDGGSVATGDSIWLPSESEIVITSTIGTCAEIDAGVQPGPLTSVVLRLSNVTGELVAGDYAISCGGGVGDLSALALFYVTNASCANTVSEQGCEGKVTLTSVNPSIVGSFSTSVADGAANAALVGTFTAASCGDSSYWLSSAKCGE